MQSPLIKKAILWAAVYAISGVFGLAHAAYDPECTPNPATLTLSTGASKTVSYTCNNLLPGPNANYELRFNSVSGITVQPPAGPAKNPYTITITAGQQAGNYTVPINAIAFGGGWTSVDDANPLQVVVISGPAPKTPKITWTNPNLQAVANPTTASITWNNNATVSPPGTITYTLKVNGSTVSTNANTPYVLQADQLVSGSNSIEVDATSEGAVSIPATTTLQWTPPAPPKISGVMVCTPETVKAGDALSCTATFKLETTGNLPVGRVSITDFDDFTWKKTEDTCASPTGNSCLYTFAVTVPADTKKTSDQFTAVFTDSKHSGNTATAKQTIQITPAAPPPASVSGSMTCTPQSVTPGNSVSCTATFTAASGEIQAGAVTTTDANQFSITPGQETCRSPTGTDCTYAFTVQVPSDTTDASDTVTAVYTNTSQPGITGDAQNVIQITQPSSSKYVTLGSLTCDKTNLYPNEQTQCAVNIQGNGVEDLTNVQITASASQGTTGTVSGSCPTGGTTFPKDKSCTANFSYTAPSTPGTETTSLLFTDDQGDHVQKSAQITVAKAQVSISPIACYSNQQYGDATSCECGFYITNSDKSNIHFSNMIAAVTPDGSNANPTMPTNNCSGIVGPTQSCEVSFNYTPITKAGNYTLTVSGDIAGEQIGSAPSALNIGSLKISSDVVGKVQPESSTNLPPPNYVKKDGVITIQYLFINNSSANQYYNPYAYLVTPESGAPILLPSSSIGGTCVQTKASRYLAPNGSCILSVTFTPSDYPQLKTSDQVILSANLRVGSVPLCQYAKVSQSVSWPLVIGDTPIYSALITNRQFVASGKAQSGTYPNNPLFSGAFVFENNTGSDITGLNPVVRSFTSNGTVVTNLFQPVSCSSLSSTYLGGTESSSDFLNRLSQYQDCGSSLAAGASCAACFTSVSGEPLSEPSYTFAAQLTYSTSGAYVSKTIATNPTYRKLTLYNQCSASVWPAFVGGAAYYYCNYQNDCPLNTTCNVAKHECKPNAGVTCTQDPNICPNFTDCNTQTGLCYWGTPNLDSTGAQPSTMQIQNKGSMVFQIPSMPVTNAGYVWKGSVLGRTGCTGTGSACATGNCDGVGSNGVCPIGKGGNPPATQAEMTLHANSGDFYDVEIINGFNIPVSMSPDQGVPNDTDAYYCRTAGEPISATIQGSLTNNQCTWEFTMQSYQEGGQEEASMENYIMLHNFVTSGGAACTSQSYCQQHSANGTVCGISQDNKTTGTKTCGQLLGFWSTSQLCSENPAAYNTVLNCQASGSGATNLQWLGCNGGNATNSCYGKSPVDQQCCGCPYWSAANSKATQPPQAFNYLANILGGNFVLYPNSQGEYCKAYSSYWINNVMLPDLIWMKRGCSSAYTFPYDDASATFICSNAKETSQDTANTQNYTITFCPNGSDGKPMPGVVNSSQIYMPPDQ